jgi:hypothetical protein
LSVLNTIQHNVFVPLALPVALIGCATIIRLGRIAWFHFRQRGFPPIKIQASPDGHGSEFAALLSAYLAQDTPDAVIVIPPGGHGPEAAYPMERPGSSSSWFRTAVRIALSAEPAFEVHVKYVRADRTQHFHQATVRVTKTPRNRVVMATSVGHRSETQLVQQLGCRISHSIHQTRGVLSHTPRWERWGTDWEGYFKYRCALEKERKYRSTLEKERVYRSSHEKERKNNYRSALALYDKAIAIEPGNFVISMRKGALLELMQRYDEAVTVYRTCGELWHENIEARYRLAAALSNAERPEEAAAILKDLNKHRLTRLNLWHLRSRTWFMRRNAGERRYWRGWLKRRFVFYGLSKWKAYKTAVQVGLVITDVQILGSRKQSGITLEDIMVRLMKITRRRVDGSGYNRLLHPELPADKLNFCLHCATWHKPSADKELIMPEPQPVNKPWSGIGWLAHYNASLCFSLLIGFAKEQIPDGYDHQHWRLDCARAAILEIGFAKRDPRNHLEPSWYQTDPGLQPLRRFLRGHRERWAKFVGLDSRIFGSHSYTRLAIRRKMMRLLRYRR